jgi:hypothetical protein
VSEKDLAPYEAVNAPCQQVIVDQLTGAGMQRKIAGLLALAGNDQVRDPRTTYVPPSPEYRAGCRKGRYVIGLLLITLNEIDMIPVALSKRVKADEVRLIW